ncbi:hypothetical protein GGF32_006889 [Allomyces javanicus]|nr:hypothetical protein GGF32_006889 [Allomyces javanicus]
MDAATSTTASPATTPTASRRGSTTAPSGLPTPTATTTWRAGAAVPSSPATGIPRPHVAATTARTPVAVPPSTAADSQTNNLPRKTSAARLATAPAVVPGKKAAVAAACKPARTPTTPVADAPRAEWNSSVSDLDKLRLSPEEQERRKRLLAPQPGQYLPPRSSTSSATTAPRTRRRITPADSPTWPDHPPPAPRAPKVRAAPSPVGDDATSWTADTDSDDGEDVDEDVRAFERRRQGRKQHVGTSRSRSRARRVGAAVETRPVAAVGNAWPRDATRRLALALAYARAAVHSSEPLVDESELPEDDDEGEWASAATAAKVVDQMAVAVTVLARKVSELSADAVAERARRVEGERDAAKVREELADIRAQLAVLSTQVQASAASAAAAAAATRSPALGFGLLNMTPMLATNKRMSALGFGMDPAAVSEDVPIGVRAADLDAANADMDRALLSMESVEDEVE